MGHHHGTGREQGHASRFAPPRRGGGHDTPEPQGPRPAGGGWDGPRRLPFAVLAAAFLVWSGLAWIGWQLVDPVLGWLSGNADAIAATGRSLAAAAGGEAGIAVQLTKGVDAGGLLAGVVGALAAALKAAILLVWAGGIVALVALPALLRFLRRGRYSRR